MLLRAVRAVVVLPGIFAGLIPWLVTRADDARNDGLQTAALLSVAGFALFCFCVRDFAIIGKGTLAPWDPPKRLIVTGPYRFTRNPMYIAIILFLAGWALFIGSRALAWYALILTIGFHLRVLLYEEPRLKKNFSEDWSVHAANVPRWIPRLTPWCNTYSPEDKM